MARTSNKGRFLVLVMMAVRAHVDGFMKRASDRSNGSIARFQGKAANPRHLGQQRCRQRRA
jgi:hypothetical protein